MVLRRGWRIAICLLLCVCMAFSCVSSVYAAGLVPYIVLQPLPVIASTLIASGVKPNDENDFNDLCININSKIDLGPSVSLSVVGDRTYIPTSIAKSILGEAVKQSVYSPKKLSSYTVNGKNYRFVASNTDLSKTFVSLATISSIPTKETWTPVTAPFGWACKLNSSERMILQLKSSPILTRSYFDIYSGLKLQDPCGWNYSYAYPLELGDIVYMTSPMKGLYYTVRCAHGDVFSGYLSQVSVAGGEISVRFPWEVTDDLPGVSSAGTLDSINARWLALEREIAGALSIPLSVPADTVAGAAAQTQAEAQSGTKTKDVAIDVVSDSAADSFFGKGKLSFALSDFFPFCIPFDIIRGVKLLVAPAKAPVFDVPIKIPYIPQQVIHIDLTQYAGIAVFSRWFLTLVFVWGLAAGTHKVIKW